MKPPGAWGLPPKPPALCGGIMPWLGQLPAGGCMACGVWLCQLPGVGWPPNWPACGVPTVLLLDNENLRMNEVAIYIPCGLIGFG